MLTTACGGLLAFAQYREGGGRTPFALIVLEFECDRVVNMTSFLDTEALFPLSGFETSFFSSDR